MARFYCLNFNERSSELLVEATISYDDQKLLTGEFSPRTPLKLIKSQGRHAYDIVRLQDVFNFLISKTVFKHLQKAGLTGWKTYEVELSGLNNEYLGFQVTGKAGPIKRPKESGFVVGYQFDVNTWDGSDFFICDTTLGIVVTERAKDVLDTLNIKNVEMVETNQYEWYCA